MNPFDFEISRRNLLKGAAVSVAAAPLVSGLSGCVLDSSSDAPDYKTKLVLLGTTGGVSWFQGCKRASSSSAIVVNGTIYLVDIGQGSANRLSEYFNTPDGQPSSTFLKNMRALFFTHLHQDHTADYASFLLIGPGAGLGVGPYGPLKIYGPCDRGQLDIDKSDFLYATNPANTYPFKGQVLYNSANPNSTLAAPTPGPISPTPGIRQMTDTIWQAFAVTINNMGLDAGYPYFRDLVDVHEFGTGLATPTSDVCPPAPPFPVYSDENITVTAALVNHVQVYPSVAFRFDISGGPSVVFSGDTGKETNWNLQTLANGADYLVHEVIDPAWINAKFGVSPTDARTIQLKNHMTVSHTSVDDVGKVASECNVRTLVLNHIVPGTTPYSTLQRAQNGFSGRLIIGEDLMTIGLG